MVHNRDGFVSGHMSATRAMGWERDVFLSFYPQSEAPAVLQVELADGLVFSSYARRRFERYGIYQEGVAGKVFLRIPAERPTLFELLGFSKTLYITPGDTLTINIEADTTLEFAGPHAAENRLLQNFLDRHADEESPRGWMDRKQVAKTDPEAYAAKLKQETIQQRNELEMMKLALGPVLFTQLYERIPYVQAGKYADFLWPYSQITSSDLQSQKATPPTQQRFLDFIADIPVYNANLMFPDYGFPPYDNFLREYQNFLNAFNRNDRGMASTGSSGYNQTYDLNFVSGYFGGYPWHYLTADVLLEIAGTLEGRLNNFAPLFDEFLATCKDSVLEKEVATLYHAKKALQRGNRFPEVGFTDRNGQPVSMSDLTGSKALLYLVTEADLGPMHFLSDKTPVVTTVMDSLNSLREKNISVELIFLYVGAEPDVWQKIVDTAPDDVHLWQVPRDRTETVDFIYNLRRAKALYQKTWFLIDEKQMIFKTGIINSALQRNDKAQHARKIQEFFDRELQLFSLHKASLIDPRLKRWGFLALGVLVPVALLSWLVARWRIRSVRKREEEKRRITEIELRAIRAQLNPHFIFNTMNSIQHLVGSGESEKASGYLSDLAVLMRMVLKHTERGMISLAEELAAVEKYISLEQLRFSFQYRVDIDPSVDRHNTLVPAMLLQPYVENAVLHGMNGKGMEGRLRIGASQHGNWMTYTIEDNGPGIGHAAAARNGNRMSLKLMREKLRLVYGEDMHLEILDLADAQEKSEGSGSEHAGSRGARSEGTRVVIRLPVFV